MADVLRTPDEQFNELPDFPWSPGDDGTEKIYKRLPGTP